MRELPKRKDIKTESLIEDILLREFNLRGIYLIPQFQIGRYRIDLALPEKKLAIECDGKEWHSTEEQIKRDNIRQKEIEDLGWVVIRFSGSEIYKFADEIAVRLFGGSIRRLDSIKIPTDECLDNEEKKYFERINESIQYEARKEVNTSSIGDIISERFFKNL
jgi:very-short-patch-repair endonuclease